MKVYYYVIVKEVTVGRRGLKEEISEKRR